MKAQFLSSFSQYRLVSVYFSQQDTWTRQQVKLNKADPFWQHVGFLVAQVDGLQAGVAHWAKSQGKTVSERYSHHYFDIIFISFLFSCVLHATVTVSED